MTSRLTLASTSPQRRAILEQLCIPFTAVAPSYVEHDPPDADPVTLVRDHAEGKARIGACGGRGHARRRHDRPSRRPRSTARPPTATTPVPCSRELAGRTHRVLSGLCLLGDGFAVVEHATTDVTFRALSAAEIDAYLDSEEWGGRAGSYAIQGLGARLVARIDGDYLNVVGLPAALLIDTLAAHVPNLLQIDTG